MTKKNEVIKPQQSETKELVVVNPMLLLEQATKQGVDVVVMEKLMDLQERWEKNQAKKAFNDAMAAFQAECPVINKSKAVKGKDGKDRYSYTPLGEIVRQVKDILSKHGLSYRFDEIKDDNFTTAVCIVTHQNGHSEQSGFKIKIGTEEYMTDTQKYGARMTFAKRYAFCNALGILTAEVDNDAAPDETEESSKGIESLMKLIKTANGQEVEQLMKKMDQSKKYTAAQKNDFAKAAFERIEEIQKAKSNNKPESSN